MVFCDDSHSNVKKMVWKTGRKPEARLISRSKIGVENTPGYRRHTRSVHLSYILLSVKGHGHLTFLPPGGRPRKSPLGGCSSTGAVPLLPGARPEPDQIAQFSLPTWDFLLHINTWRTSRARPSSAPCCTCGPPWFPFRPRLPPHCHFGDTISIDFATKFLVLSKAIKLHYMCDGMHYPLMRTVWHKRIWISEIGGFARTISRNDSISSLLKVIL